VSDTLAAPVAAGVCARCHTELAPGALSCPVCGALQHTAALEALAATAQEREAAGDLTGAMGAWGDARVLLPAASRQHQAITARIDALARRVDAGEGTKAPRAAKQPNNGARAGVVATVLLLLAKFKTVIFLVLAKGKFLLLGLSKLTTLFSMFAFLGFAWKLWGWQLGAGLVACLYVHEMGHVWQLRRYGMRAGAPFFVPGLGAFVALRDHPVTPRVDSRIGLAGPLWGFGAILASCAVYLATGNRLWLAIGSITAMIHIFNMVPVWQLDGSRGFSSLSRRQRWMVTGAMAAVFLATQVPLVLAVAGVSAWRARSAAPDEEDWRGFTTYLVLATAFALLAPGAPLGITR
jgi:Zn-dependent protease